MTKETEKLNALSALSWIARGLEVPKSQFNKFGGYHYRSCEDILNAIKKSFKGLDGSANLRLYDEIVLIGERYYVKATAEFSYNNATITNTAYAREEESKKGMDGSQVTGAASSYARKYALNGLFLIDDVKDSDATNDHGKDKPEAKPEPKVTELLKKEFESFKKQAFEATAETYPALRERVMAFNKRQDVPQSMVDELTAEMVKTKKAIDDAKN